VTPATVPAQPRRSGQPPLCPPELATRIIELHQQGLGYQAISDALNSEGVLTPLGRPRWTKSHVSRLLFTRHMKNHAAELAAPSLRSLHPLRFMPPDWMFLYARAYRFSSTSVGSS
jgi:hypothetical protein